jgi:hypothetical protein
MTVDASSWDLFKTLHYVLKEVTRIAKQEKAKIKGKRDGYGKRRSLSFRMKEGEFSPGGKPLKD